MLISVVFNEQDTHRRSLFEDSSSSSGQVAFVVVVIILSFNSLSADILRHFIKQHDRNVIAWTTSIIVFTPFITAIAYLLTWPKNQKFSGLMD